MGKKIISLKISVIPTNKGYKEPIQIQEQETHSEGTKLLIKYGVPKKEALQLYEEKGEETIIKVCNKWVEYIETGCMPDGKTPIKSAGKLLEWAISVGDMESEFETKKKGKLQEQIQLQNEAERREIEKHEKRKKREQTARKELEKMSLAETVSRIFTRIETTEKNLNFFDQTNREILRNYIIERKNTVSSLGLLYAETIARFKELLKVKSNELQRIAEKEREIEEQKKREEGRKHGLQKIKELRELGVI